jgi:hypothetical protein
MRKCDTKSMTLGKLIEEIGLRIKNEFQPNWSTFVTKENDNGVLPHECRARQAIRILKWPSYYFVPCSIFYPFVSVKSREVYLMPNCGQSLENLPDQGEWNPSNRFGKWVWYRHWQLHLYMRWYYELKPEMSIANAPSLLKTAIVPELYDARDNSTSN